MPTEEKEQKEHFDRKATKEEILNLYNSIYRFDSKNKENDNSRKEKDEKKEAEYKHYLEVIEEIISNNEDDYILLKNELEDANNETDSTLKAKEIRDAKLKLATFSKKIRIQLLNAKKDISLDTIRELKKEKEYADPMNFNIDKFFSDSNLTENLINKKISKPEEKLIFGETLDIISEINTLNEIVDPISGEKETTKIASATKLNNAQKSVNSAMEKKIEAEKSGDIQTKINANNNLLQAKGTQIKVKQMVTEDASETIERAINYKDAQLAHLADQKKKTDLRFQQQADRIRDQKQKLQASKESLGNDDNNSVSTNESLNKKSNTESSVPETVAISSDGKEKVSDIAIEKLDESVAENKQYSEYSKMVFNGESGNILKYIINDEINNGNISSMKIANKIKEDKEGAAVIKKIKFYLRKTVKGISYDEYIDLKVQKNKFKQIYNRIAKEIF